MKIEKIKRYSNKLLRLKLIQTKIYDKKHQHRNTIIEEIEARLKKALHLIFKYHAHNKKIVFIGGSSRINQKIKFLLKNTNHTLIPESIWMNGIITNQTSNFKDLTHKQKSIKKRISTMVIQLRKKSDLMVILDRSKNLNALKEGYISKIPIISLNNELSILEKESQYKVPGNFTFTKKKIRDNLFYSMLAAAIKKATITKTKR